MNVLNIIYMRFTLENVVTVHYVQRSNGEARNNKLQNFCWKSSA
jgi:hypothetical protein